MSPNELLDDTWPNKPENGVVAPWQILDIGLFQQFMLTYDEFWCENKVIG